MKSLRHKIFNSDVFVAAIKALIPESPFIQGMILHYPQGSIILHEGAENDSLYVIIEGNVAMEKGETRKRTRIDIQGPGDFFGLLSFHTGEPVFTTSIAHTDASLLVVNHQNYEELIIKYPNLSNALQGLIFSNLADRYRRVVSLHVHVDYLTQELKKEKEQLKQTIKQLEKTRTTLVSHEKMAVLGQLTAGLAHEMNNPASALLRSVDFLTTNLPDMLDKASLYPERNLVRYFFEIGQKRVFISSEEQREKTRILSDKFPHLNRSYIRVLADMSQDAFDIIVPYVRNIKRQQQAHLYLDAFQAGVFVSGIRISSKRIENLVKSLRNFNRQSYGEMELVDIRNGLKDTLLLLGNRLKNITVETLLPDVPLINCLPGEINQVWTNIIINACDALGGKGELYISCAEGIPGTVCVTIADNGQGIPNKFKKRIFDTNFTTKTAGGEFGLGLGLSISKNIIEKHQGTIFVGDRPGGGAMFKVCLPASLPHPARKTFDGTLPED